MFGATEIVRGTKPYEVNAGPGDLVGFGQKVEEHCVDRVATVLENREHGFFVWLDCEEKASGHVHRLQLYRRDRPKDDPIVYCEILERISPPDWEPVRVGKDPADVPG